MIKYVTRHVSVNWSSSTENSEQRKQSEQIFNEQKSEINR